MQPMTDYPISYLVPHSDSMCLLDRVLEAGLESFQTQLTIRETSLFYAQQGIGSWIGLEYMAQTVAAWAGWHARQKCTPPKVGFLLGTRRYDCLKSHFLLNEILNISIQREFQAANGLAQFLGVIKIENKIVANAAITVFEPKNIHDFLKDHTDGK